MAYVHQLFSLRSVFSWFSRRVLGGDGANLCLLPRSSPTSYWSTHQPFRNPLHALIQYQEAGGEPIVDKKVGGHPNTFCNTAFFRRSSHHFFSLTHAHRSEMSEADLFAPRGKWGSQPWAPRSA